MFEQCKTVMASVGVDKVIQFVSDSGPDAAKCRRMLMNEYPHIIGAPCVAHSLDLLIEDILKVPFFDSVDKRAVGVVNYTRNHDILRSALLDCQGRTLLHPVATRFAASVTMIERLYDSRQSLLTIYNGDVGDTFRGHLQKREHRESFDEIRATVNSTDFWRDLRYVLRVVLPIWHILRIADGHRSYEMNAHIYFSLHELDMYYVTDEDIREEHRSELQRLMMARWSFLESPAHDVGFLLNPLHFALKPWSNDTVMQGFNLLNERWGNSDVLSEFEYYCSGAWRTDMASDRTINEYLEKIKTPMGLYQFLESKLSANNQASSNPNPNQPSSSQSTNSPSSSQSTNSSQSSNSSQSTNSPSSSQSTSFNLTDTTPAAAHSGLVHTHTLRGFWRLFGAKIPNIQALAIKTYSQPVSQSPVEQLFSTYDYLMGSKRNKLAFETQEKLLFIKSNYKVCNKRV